MEIAYTLYLQLEPELASTFSYTTKNNGEHCWFKYTGNKTLKNTASNLGIDLRIGFEEIDEKNWKNGGYVKWHPRDSLDIRNCTHLIKETSKEMNEWLEKLFA